MSTPRPNAVLRSGLRWALVVMTLTSSLCWGATPIPEEEFNSPNPIADLGVTPPPMRDGEPVEVALNIRFNKIVSIDEVDETYTLDAYLEARWQDERLKSNEAKRMFIGDQADRVLRRIWWPYFEFINTVGSREIQNRRITLESSGDVIYFERFRASLTNNMDFRKYPFDQQKFTVKIESFGYDRQQLMFVANESGANTLESHEEWENLQHIKPEIELRSNGYVRITMGIEADRKPDYFYYQFFLPLLLIIGSSWIVFWLQSFSEQISIGFTLMLTLVAFTFFTSTLLPRLPYNTFIELSVLSGYVSIFASILAVVLHHHFDAKRVELFRACRWLFPAAYLLAGLVTVGVYL